VSGRLKKEKEEDKRKDEEIGVCLSFGCGLPDRTQARVPF
jgi:hypothetical protein